MLVRRAKQKTTTHPLPGPLRTHHHITIAAPMSASTQRKNSVLYAPLRRKSSQTGAQAA